MLNIMCFSNYLNGHLNASKPRRNSSIVKNKSSRCTVHLIHSKIDVESCLLVAPAKTTIGSATIAVGISVAIVIEVTVPLNVAVKSIFLRLKKRLSKARRVL